jgi:hypothetical protein
MMPAWDECVDASCDMREFNLKQSERIQPISCLYFVAGHMHQSSVSVHQVSFINRKKDCKSRIRVHAYEAHSADEIKLHANIHDFHIPPYILYTVYLNRNRERTCVLVVRRKAAGRCPCRSCSRKLNGVSDNRWRC